MMLTPCGPSAVPTGGAGVAEPACSCTLTSAAIFFLGGIAFYFLSCGHSEGGRPLPRVVATALSARERAWVKSSDLLDLREGELDRGLAAEDLHEGLDALRLGVDLGDGRVERGERTVDHHDRVGHVEVRDLDGLARGGGGALVARGRGLGLGDGDDGRREHVLDLAHAERDGLVAVAHEAGHGRRVAHGRPRLVGEVHADEDVAGEDGARDHFSLAVLDLRDLLGQNHDLVVVLLHVEGDDAVLEVVLDPLLHAGVGVHDEPVTRLRPQLATEGLERVVLVGGLVSSSLVAVRLVRGGVVAGRLVLRHVVRGGRGGVLGAVLRGVLDGVHVGVPGGRLDLVLDLVHVKVVRHVSLRTSLLGPVTGAGAGLTRRGSERWMHCSVVVYWALPPVKTSKTSFPKARSRTVTSAITAMTKTSTTKK